MPGFKGVEISLGSVMGIRENSDVMTTEARLFGEGRGSGRDGEEIRVINWALGSASLCGN